MFRDCGWSSLTEQSEDNGINGKALSCSGTAALKPKPGLNGPPVRIHLFQFNVTSS